MSNNTKQSGDTHQDVASMAAGKTGYMYAFVSDADLSAGLWSNSENNVNRDWQRVVANAAEKDGYRETGLSSNYWTWQSLWKEVRNLYFLLYNLRLSAMSSR